MNYFSAGDEDESLMTSKQDGAVLHLHQDGPVGPEVGGAEGAHPGNDGELYFNEIWVGCVIAIDI
jgi:hypothetical protein